MQDLHELEAIRQLKYRYMRCVDQKRWDELAQLFTEDAVSSYSDGKYHFEGREKIMEFLVSSMDRKSFLSSHRVTQPEIEITSPSTARAIWALEDTVIDTQHEIMIRGAAFYTDEYVKVDGEWKIRSTGYSRTFEEMFSRKDIPSLRLTSPKPEAS